MNDRRVLIGVLLAAIGVAALGLGVTSEAIVLPDLTSTMGGSHQTVASLTLPVVVGAGLVDGFNPCAFAVLLVFISSALALMERRALGGESVSARGAILGMGSVYVAGVFLTYLSLGLGLLGAASFFPQTHVVSRIAAVLAMFIGLFLLKEALLPELGSVLAIPDSLHGAIRHWARRTSVPALFGAGVLVGLCTVPCSGAVYLAVLALLSSHTTRVEGFGYLVLYNLAFVLPLVVILMVASSRHLLNRMARWQLHHRSSLKMLLGGLTILLGMGILFAV